MYVMCLFWISHAQHFLRRPDLRLCGPPPSSVVPLMDDDDDLEEEQQEEEEAATATEVGG